LELVTPSDFKLSVASNHGQMAARSLADITEIDSIADDFVTFSRLAKRDTVTAFCPKNDKKTLNTSDYL
jgi:hypothetical protein